VEHVPWSDANNQMRRRALTTSTGWRVLQGRGRASGHLMGGCIEVLEFLKGTEWWPEARAWDGAILFIETSQDAPSPEFVKWWLRNYGSQGILQRLAGILFGRPGGATVPAAVFDAYDKAIADALAEVGMMELPVITRMDFGHTDPMFVLPYGVRATMDCERGVLEIEEATAV
jgi:muramoyltetrapeptide carboxypeptidase LdcA involved in peptidoglycan recycling